jgi:two-component system chemotaxis sensor kinase CheA
LVLPEDVIDRFRVAALERLERLETAWMQLTADPNDAEAIAAIERDVHTLKADSRMVGFTDVDMVAHKLEDVLGVARERNFQISDDVDLVVTMALRFMTMLIRKKAGQTLGGIDLPGFVQQIDAVVRETRRQHPLPGRSSTSPSVKLDPNKELLSAVVRDRLASVALDLFLELASGRDSRRLRRSWNQLRDSLAPPDPSAIAPVLAKHEAGAEHLARELGKDVTVTFVLDPIARTAAPIIEALDIAALHLVRNAIDHGIAARGQLRVRCEIRDEHAILEVADDGQGIDFARVHDRAADLGLIACDARPTDAELSKLLFYSGLSTRGTPSVVSGRGIGLDAVHSAVDAVGGTIEVASKPGGGTTWTITIPSPSRSFPVHRFTIRGTALPFAVPAEWKLEVAQQLQGSLDLVEELGLGTPTTNPLTLLLTRGATTVQIGAATEPILADARWLVATSADTVAGVVAIDGTECLVIRPEALVTCSGKVTIVDDSEIVRELVGFSLKPYGIEVIPFDEPGPLIGTLAVRPVDLVLLDLSFKGLDIAGLIQRIKAALPACVVYLHSDRTPIELAQIAETSKADGHLSKTIGRDQFVARVLRILRSRRGG